MGRGKKKKKNTVNASGAEAGRTAEEPVGAPAPEEEAPAADGVAEAAAEKTVSDTPGTADEPASEEAAEPAPEEIAPDEPAAEEPADYAALIEKVTSADIKDGGASVVRRKKGGLFSLVLYIAFIGVFIASVFMLGENIYAKYKGSVIYGDLADQFENGGAARYTPRSVPKAMMTMSERIANGGESGAAEGADLARVRASLTSLSRTNPEIYGWIAIPGTPVNYPVVRGSDNEFYLDHAYTGDYLPVGSIFADFSTADSVTDNVNLVIYGHNVTDGSMFGSLSDVFAEQSYFDSCRIYLYTMDGIFTYRPFSVHEPREDSGFIRTAFSGPDDVAAFIKWLSDDSEYKAGDVETDGNSKILTLSTCTGYGQENRFAVHAVLISSVTD
ncbi:MAG: class B sortase [Clostridia bacterium]|nr:class B sortase [Clostridia bacterium]